MLKALSLTQPWATLCAIGPDRGGKRVETRSWRTEYRGWLAIHASKGFPPWAREFFMQEYFRQALVAAGYSGPHQLPTGAIVGVARLAQILPTERILRQQQLSIREQAYGDYAPGRFGWFLENNLVLPDPIPCKGALSLWEVPAPIVRQIEQQFVSIGVVINFADSTESPRLFLPVQPIF